MATWRYALDEQLGGEGVFLHRHEPIAEIAFDILFIDLNEHPEGLLGRQVHEEDGSDRCLGLTVANIGIVNGVGFEHVEQTLLPRTSARSYVTARCIHIDSPASVVSKHFVIRKRSREILANVFEHVRRWRLRQIEVEHASGRTVPIGILVTELGRREMVPRLATDGGRNAFSAACFHLVEASLDEGRPSREHLEPFLFASTSY